MTRRLALAILLIVWATLIAGGIVAYFTTRSVLLADLDAVLVNRARTLPELSGQTESAARMEEAAGDRYVISNHLSQTRGRLIDSVVPAPQPAVLHAALVTLGDGRRVRTLSLQFTPREGGGAIHVSYTGSAERFHRVLDRLAMALAIFGIAAGALAAGVAVLVSRAALRPLRGTVDVIGGIDESKIDRRIDASALPPELQPVAARLNEMLDRLQQAFVQRKQFLADASHELRTPVAALVTTLEVALRRPREAVELTRVLRTCLSDARMLRQLVQTLLEHARSETRDAQVQAVVFDALVVLNQCADVAEGLALARDVTVRRNLPHALEMTSQPSRLRGIVMNLLGNAVEHNRPGGAVDFHAEVRGNMLEIVITDTGAGIPAEHLPHIFQPFYRAQAENPDSDAETGQHHLGLGLFLVDSHIKALGGECTVESEVGVGTTFRVRLTGIVATVPALLEASA